VPPIPSILEALIRLPVNTEVYAQSSNMLKAFFEIRKEKQLKFVAIIDGDPPQPMHEDDISESQANLDLCGITDHFLLNRNEIRHLLPDIGLRAIAAPLEIRGVHVVHQFPTLKSRQLSLDPPKTTDVYTPCANRHLK
jgi:hypothetical protein